MSIIQLPTKGIFLDLFLWVSSDLAGKSVLTFQSTGQLGSKRLSLPKENFLDLPYLCSKHGSQEVGDLVEFDQFDSPVFVEEEGEGNDTVPQS